MKLAIIVGTRPEIIRLSAIINNAEKYFEVVLMHTGQNYDYNLNDVFFKDLSIKKPDYYMDCSVDNLGRTVGDIIAKSYELFVETKPDAILIDGDTNSCLCAYSAKRLKIPIFHFEAGHRCFDINVPEEINRKLVDHLSDINICYTEHARKNLLKENLPPQYIFTVGSPMREVINNIRDKIEMSDIMKKFNLTSENYFVWSSHREENVNIDKNFTEVVNSINKLAETYNLPVIFSVHPRTMKRIKEKGIAFNKNVVLMDPCGIIDYCKLQMNSKCVISDSGTLTEETDILKFRGVLLRTMTEKTEGMEAGTIVMGNIKWDILQSIIKMILEMNISPESIADYKNENVSEKVCKIIIGYQSIVNKYIWMK